MLVPISIPPAVHEILHLLVRFWQAHGIFVLGSFAAGALVVFLLYNLFSFHHLRAVRRIITLAEEADIAELRYGSRFNLVHVIRVLQRNGPHVQNLQAPGARGIHTGGEILKRFGDEVIYYFPENSLEGREGIAIPEMTTWVIGDPPVTQLPLHTTPVSVPPGEWRPAFVKKSTGLTHVLRSIKPGFRNLYIGDFVMKGDILGTVSETVMPRRTPVRAPVSGFIVQFGAYPSTTLAQDASAMLIGAVPEVVTYRYTGDLAGYFNCVPASAESCIGLYIERDALLASVRVLFGSIPIPIHAPTRMRIVRQFVRNGDPVQYDQPLFAYIPLP